MLFLTGTLQPTIHQAPLAVLAPSGFLRLFNQATSPTILPPNAPRAFTPAQSRAYILPETTHFIYAFFKSLNHIAIKHRLRCLPRREIIILLPLSILEALSITILPPSASALAPAKAGHTSSPKLPTSSMLFKSLNHIDAKQRLSLFAPSGFLRLFNQATSPPIFPPNAPCAFAPAQSRAYILPETTHFIYAFLSSLNHLSTKQRLSLLAPKGNYQFTSSLY